MSETTQQSKRVILQTSTDILQLDSSTGQLISFRSKHAPDQEFVLPGQLNPVFTIQYLDDNRNFQQITSLQASSHDTVITKHADTVTATTIFSEIAGYDIQVRTTVVASPHERFSRWSLSVQNSSGLLITDIQFPYMVLSYKLAGSPGSEAIVWPFGPGTLFRSPQPQDLLPDSPHTWQLLPENGDIWHYPGYNFAQFMAFYNDRAGFYIACDDSSGMVKMLKPVHHEPGLRLGICHIGDWPRQGERELGYNVIIGSFTGDWYSAASLYREWSLQQAWASKPLYRRDDMPGWLLDSPPHIIVRIQGQLDIGPTQPNAEFLPYRKCIPLLEALAQKLDAPLVPVIMAWERPGPWVYPDCFPPAGGAESLREFTAMARERQWHIGTFCNGTRWVTGHFWSGYQGDEYYVKQGGALSICRTNTGEPWHEAWDASWRPSYAACMGTQMTRDIATEFVRTIIDLGLDWIQFFDQNVGACTFPCFATDHEHPETPGRWMTEAMRTTISSFQQLAGAMHNHDRSIALSVEGLVNEYFLPDFHVCDVRVVPPGHTPSSWIPLYHFLYHEFIVIQGGFGSAPEPYHMPIRNAYNWVTGEIPGAVMKGNGELLNWDTMNWASWEPQVGSENDAVAMLRATTVLRRGAARDFLLFGRMLAPATPTGIAIMNWQYGGKDHHIPAVFHAAWQAPDSHVGLVFANWTNEPQSVRVDDERLGKQVTIHISAASVTTSMQTLTGSMELTLPPLSCCLVESQQ